MKKLLSLFASFCLAATGASNVVSCSNHAEKEPKSPENILSKITITDLGSLNNLTVLTGEEDYNGFTNDNVFNADFKNTSYKKIDGFGDYGVADDKIGYYEVATKAFQLNNIKPDYGTWTRINFSLEKANDEHRYKLTMVLADKTVKFVFTSDEDIQETINSKIDGNKLLEVEDGSIDTIFGALDKRYPESNINFALNDRMYQNKNESGSGSLHTVSFNDAGIGTVELYDKKDNLGGTVIQKVKIDNYDSSNIKDNWYYYYNDISKAQQKRLNTIDKSYKVTSLNPKKHVIMFGLDGLRYDKFNKYIFDRLDKKEILKEQTFYSQIWESVWGWKKIISGTVGNNNNNIFRLVNKSKNNDEMTAIANLEWSGWENSVFKTNNLSSDENIKGSFNKDEYLNWSDDDVSKEWIGDAREIIKSDPNWSDVDIPNNPGKIDDMNFANGICNATPNEIKLNALKSWTLYKKLQSRISKSMPNLVFQYDTQADDEGHKYNYGNEKSNEEYYNSKALQATYDVYVKELNDMFDKYADNPDYLLIVTTDHGRDQHDPSHKGYDPDARRSFIVSNQDVSKYTTGDINGYSIKEIIYNFLKTTD